MADLLDRMLTPAFFALLYAALLLVLAHDWRLSLVALAVEYLGVAVLLRQLVVMDVALVKVFVGLLVVTIFTLTGAQLGFGRAPTAPGGRPRLRFEVPTGFAFRLMAMLMVLAFAVYIANQPQLTLPGLNDRPLLNMASYLLMTLGLLSLGLTEEPMNAGMALLTLLNGFELFYAAVEPSLAVVALLAAVAFAIALAVSFMAIRQYAAATPVAE